MRRIAVPTKIASALWLYKGRVFVAETGHTTSAVHRRFRQGELPLDIGGDIGSYVGAFEAISFEEGRRFERARRG